MRKRISLQLIAGFIGIVTVAVLVIGSIFIGLYQRAALDARREDMLNRSRNLAPLMSAYMGGTGMMRGMGGLFRMMDVVADAQIWLLDAQGQPLSLPGTGTMGAMGMDGHEMGTGEGATPLPGTAQATIHDILAGREAVNETFSDVYGEATLTVGVPVLAEDGTILGGILMHTAANNVTAGLGKAYRLLLFGLGAGLLAAVGLGIAFSLRFTRPLTHMNRLAHAMAGGDYTVRAGLARQDEIGQLGDALDHLATSLEEASQESARLEAMRRDFIANVSHEFRTPLTVIRGSAEALADGAAEHPEERRHRLEAILSETAGMNRLVGDLLELSRLESGKIPLSPEPVWLGELLDDLWRGLSPLAARIPVRLERSLPEGLPPAWADYGRLRQLLLIFLDNAVKHAPADSAITLTAGVAPAAGPTGDRMHGSLEIRIRDQGPGIPPEELPRVWERFHTVNKARNRQGTGLGLPIARQLAERMGATVDLESRVGEGTTAILRLPVAAPPEE